MKLIKVIENNRIIYTKNGGIDNDVLAAYLPKKARILYTDPPWNIKYWATILKKDTGEKYDLITYRELLGYLMKLIDSYVDGFVFIEASKNQYKECLAVVKEHLYNITTHRIFYGSGNRWFENVLVSGTTKSEYEYSLDVEGMKGGLAIPKHCVGAVANSSRARGKRGESKRGEGNEENKRLVFWIGGLFKNRGNSKPLYTSIIS